ncbi:Ff.00g105930.m01.CDS01 [Fusarium sp. VM40]|nr:Ff.00g105930.m01.CDS01 [Fusarium sp. VM40]
MTRVYDTSLKCSSCHEHGPFGWLYQCSQDREEMIEEKLSYMDYLDYSFRKNMGIRKGSAEARRDKLSFLDGLTPKQMASYRPDQIATILRQREELKNVIAKEEFRKSSSALFSTVSPPPGFDVSLNNNPSAGRWIYDAEPECHYKICPRCRPICADRAFLSLNAVANGEIPPTAAAGYGFESLHGRPVIAKVVIKHINEHRPKPQVGSRRMMELLDEKIARMLIHHSQDQDRHFRNVFRSTVLAPSPARQIPTARNVAAASQRIREEEEVLSKAARDEQKAVDTKASSLPGSPWPWLAAFDNANIPDSLEEEQTPRQSSRQRSRATRIPRPTTPGSRSTRRRLTDQLLFSTSYLLPSEGNPWRLLIDGENAGTTSSTHPHSSQNTDSQENENKSDFQERSSTPPTLEDGVALTEESIEIRVPDVVTQV